MRSYERRAARRYWHQAAGYRRCELGICLGCWWRSITGKHRRVRAAMVARSRERREAVRECARTHGHDWWPIPGKGHAECSMCHAIRWEVKR